MLPSSTGYKTAIIGSMRHFSSRIELYANGPTEDPIILLEENKDTGMGDIVSIYTLEQLFQDTDPPVGSVISKEASIVLNNLLHRYTLTNTKSDLYGKLIPEIKVIIYLSLEVTPGTFEEIRLGTYRTQEWSPSDAEVTLTCHDRLYAILQLDCPETQVQHNVSIYDAFVAIFAALNIPSSDYSIDASLQTIILPYFWGIDGSVEDMFKQLCMAGTCNVSVDRYDIIQVKVMSMSITSPLSISGDNNITHADIPQSYLKVFNKVRIKQYNTVIGDTQQVFSLANVVLQSGDTSFNNIGVSTNPLAVLDTIAVSNGENITISNIDYTTWSVSFKVHNAGASRTVGITGYGRFIQATSTDLIVVNPDAFNSDKILDLNNKYIQTGVLAQSIATTVLALVSNVSAYINVEFRGNPTIELWDSLTITDEADKIDNYQCHNIRMELDYDGSLSATLLGLS